MRILAIETSCDETGIAIVDTSTTDVNPPAEEVSVTVLADELLSQVQQHAQYGGVYPSLAKREHAKNIGPLFTQALKSADLYATLDAPEIPQDTLAEIKVLLQREPELFEYLTILLATIQKPAIDAIAVTQGPGLEPALWVGVNFAQALSKAWGIPLIAVNHLEGHVATALAQSLDENTFTIHAPRLPALILLISGGHTELILMRNWLHYEKIGSTRDDAVGEAFDKSARLLGIPYPGGPEVSKLARQAREHNLEQPFSLPRPMLHDDSFDFSYSGLKTAVRTLVQSLGTPTDEQKMQIARELEDAITETLVAKVARAIDVHGIQSVILGGGVSANTEIKRALAALTASYADCTLYVSTPKLATDNGLMIALAAALSPTTTSDTIIASGNLPLY